MAIRALLTDTEYELLTVLWELDRPVTLKELLEILNSRGFDWKYPTVKAYTTQLLEGGFVTADLGGRSYLYKPALDRATYLQRNTQHYLDQQFNGSCVQFVNALIGDDTLTPAQEELLNSWILKGKKKG